VAVNLGADARRIDPPGEVELATAPGVDPRQLRPGEGVVTRAPG
jgi:hypothetical protein